MNEELRMTYLQHLGIESFFPRVALPYAQESVLCIFDEPSDGAVVESPCLDAKESIIEPQAASTVVGKVIDNLQRENFDNNIARGSPLTERPVVESPVAENAGVAALPSSQTLDNPSPAELPKFTLAVWRATVPLVVIDSHRPGEALPTERLLANILRHSLWKSPQLHRCEFQRWPLEAAREEHSGWRDAKEMLECFLDGVFVAQRVDRLWLMGEQAYRAANGESEQEEKAFSDICFTEIVLRKNGTRAVVLPSLAEVLEKPLLKGRIWPLV